MTTNDLLRNKIILTARQYVGAPFCHQGRNPQSGLDCVGLIVCVAHRLGLSDFDRADYKKIPGRRAISRYADFGGYKIRPLADMRPGDIVLLRFGRFLEHGAILTDRGAGRFGLIHACEKYGRVVEHGLSDDWRAKIIAVYSFPDLLNEAEENI